MTVTVKRDSNMKRFLSLIVVAVLAAGMLVSCAESKDLMKPFRKDDSKKQIDPSKYMVLGEYIGIEVELIEPDVVTDEKVDQSIKQTL